MALLGKKPVWNSEGDEVAGKAKLVMAAMGVGLFLFLVFAPWLFFQSMRFLLFMAPVWMPPILIYFAFQRWVEMRRSDFIKGTGMVLLELRLPRDTKKTPLAMETIFANLHIGSGESNNYKKFWKGSVRPWWSVELVSIGGSVRFYIWTRESLRRGVESFFYAQYPGIEIIEAEDYSKIFDPADASQNDMFAAEFKLVKPDPYPIKTYAEYGLDREGMKPEEQIDPLTQVIELLGSLGPNEQIWLQIIFRQTKGEKYKKKTSDGKQYSWKDEATDLIEKIRKDTARPGTYVDPVTGKVHETQGFPNPTKGQSETMAAIERNISKPGFDVGIRAIYTAPKSAYQGSVITFLLSMFNPFNNQAYNVLAPANVFDPRFNDYPWEDRSGKQKQRDHEQATEYYRRRAYFHSPYVGNWMVLSSEELATLYHIPSSTVMTPSLPRIQSATSGAPANLPT